MAKGSVADFLRRMNEQNDRLAAKAAEEAAPPEIGEDPIRLQREAERREKWGTLRAREHTSKRPHQARTIWGYVDPRS